MSSSIGDFTPSEVAILLTTCNKYEPGTQTFRFQSLIGLKENSNSTNTTQLTKTNLLNKDASNIPISQVKMASTVELEVPKTVTLKYPTKYIPPGTRFLVSFVSGDITKPIVVGGDF